MNWRRMFRRVHCYLKKEYLFGDGPYVSLSYCGDEPTAYMFTSKEEMLLSKKLIDETGCSGSCKGAGSHKALDYSWKLQRTVVG